MYLALRLVILACAFLAQTSAHSKLNTKINKIKEETNLLKQENLNQAVLLAAQNDVMQRLETENQEIKHELAQMILRLEGLEMRQLENAVATANTQQHLTQLKSDTTRNFSEVNRERDESESGLREEIDSLQRNIFGGLERMREEIEVEEEEEEETADETCGTWQLGMNLNTSDGHTMDYTTGWHDGVSIGFDSNALTRDHLNQTVWQKPADYIAIVRHQSGTVDAVKVFRFSTEGVSMYDRFDSNNPVYYRSIVTSGGHIQKSVAPGAPYMTDDPIFSVDGDLAFNWGYGHNGVRVALTEGHLSEADSEDDNTHGLGGHIACYPKTGVAISSTFAHEVSPIQDCGAGSSCLSSRNYRVLGTDHGNWDHYNSVPDYGSYALYISQDASRFPEPGYVLELEVEQCG